MERVKLVITGAASGMGFAFANYAYHKLSQYSFFPEDEKHLIYCLDKKPMYKEDFDCDGESSACSIIPMKPCDVGVRKSLPKIDGVTHLFNNAGVQDGYTIEELINVNLNGVINCTNEYATSNPSIKAVLNQASVSAHTGSEFPDYVASKGGVLAYTKAMANELASKSAICNSISFGGVLTELNKPVIDDKQKWKQIMDVTPLKKWVTPQEAAFWIWFLLFENKSMTGQDVIVDNGEMINSTFVW